MLCPRCRGEFVEGIRVCPDCEVDLAHELAEIGEPNRKIDLVTVVETGNPFEIAVAESLLAEEKISYHKVGDAIHDLFGAGRIGGLGYNLITGPVEIQVERSDLERARDVLQAMEEVSVAE